MKAISIVVPVYNEADNLVQLTDKIEAVLSGMGTTYECIFVDDGSIDDSLKVLKEIKARKPFVRVIKLRRNFGQTQAMAAGFDHAEGDIVISMDADLQNDPADIPLLIEKLNEGHDIVSGWRDKRRDPFLTRKVPSFVANRIIAVLTGVKLHDFGCTLKAYRKNVVKSLKLYGDMHRFIPAIASHAGISIAEIRVRHHSRQHGVSKYGVSRLIKVLLDLVTVKFFLSFAENPMRLFGAVGLVGMAAGFLSLVVTVYLKAAKAVDITGNPLFYITIVMLIVGAQCMLLGFLGEMNIRIYHELLHKHMYSVEEIV